MIELLWPVRRRVVVNTKSDKAFRGILWRARWRYLVLRQAEVLRGKGETVTMDGEVVIYRDNVDFLQVVS